MKYRIIIPIIVAAVIGGIGWHNHKRIADARKQQAALHEPGKQETSAGTSSGPPDKPVRKSRARKNPASIAPLLSPDDVAFMRDMQIAAQTPGTGIPNHAERYQAFHARIKAMTPAQIRKYLGELRAADDLDQDLRQRLALPALDSLIANDPQGGLDLYVQFLDLLTLPRATSNISRAVATWAGNDPAAALAWVRDNVAEHPELINSEARTAVIKGASLTDRKLAFRLIEELEIYPPSNATQCIVGTARTAEERIAALADLREYLPTISNPRDRFVAGDYALAVLGKKIASEGFESAVDWISSAGLTNSEIASFGSDLSYFIKQDERQKWIDWFAETLASRGYERPIRNLMRPWASADTDAAAAWLDNEPAGPVKNYAIGVFAVEVANRQPAAAVQWAITLPPGNLRDDTLHKIYHNWPTNDPAGKAAAAAFEKDYDIQHHH